MKLPVNRKKMRNEILEKIKFIFIFYIYFFILGDEINLWGNLYWKI